jgi:hypoxanthine phosphoribosyltransferase|tara:strand:- start:536 stop:1003 length:468 start_codon:yes stop_codon:yes gene_type:complete
MEEPKKNYFSTGQMRNALLQIEDQMVHSNWMPSMVIGINRGGLIPSVYLSHRLRVPHESITVKLRDDVKASKPDLSQLEKSFAFQHKILIVDDINDSGDTLQYIEQNFGRPKDKVRFAVLVNNKPSKTIVDYFGYEINKEEVPSWIVFPWEEWSK